MINIGVSDLVNHVCILLCTRGRDDSPSRMPSKHLRRANSFKILNSSGMSKALSVLPVARQLCIWDAAPMMKSNAMLRGAMEEGPLAFMAAMPGSPSKPPTATGYGIGVSEKPEGENDERKQ